VNAKVMVQRLRRRPRELLIGEIEANGTAPDQVEAELQELCAVWSA